MGFADKLSGILANLPLEDPLFGGLVPRKERPEERTFSEVEERPQVNRVVNERVPVRRTGMEKVNDQFINQDRQARPSNVRIDWTEQELGLAKNKQDLDQSKFMYEKGKDSREFGLKDREQDRKERDDRNRLGLDREKYDIDLRKQALEEWKSKNPEGEIKTDDDGRLMIIDKRTGKSIDTGLKTDNLGEEDKLRIQHTNRMKEIDAQNKGRQRTINPSQQRTAETDAFNDVKNSGKYKELFDKGLVELGEDGKIVINRPSDEDIQSWMPFSGSIKSQNENIANLRNKIGEFEKEWKSKSEERMNKVFSGGDDGMVDMTDPDGNALRVPKEEVERLKAAGGKVVGENSDDEPIGKMLDKMTQVDDSIELMYNDKGAVIGARNRKPAGSSR